jgi:hypothetical protein
MPSLVLESHAGADRDDARRKVLHDHRAVELRVEPLRGHRVAPLGVLLDEGAEAVHLGAGDLDAGSHGLPLVPGLPSLLREPKGSGARGERIR